MKEIRGWRCDCPPETDDEGHLVAHMVHLCPRRRPVVTQVPTDPQWSLAASLRLGRSAAPQELEIPAPDVQRRVAAPDERPPAATRLLRRCWSAGHPGAATYSRGWTVARIKISDQKAEGEQGRSKERKTQDVAVPIESVAVRTRRFVVVWTRKQGSGWKLTERWGWGPDRVIRPISEDEITEALGDR
jgi:hypothetical protein